MTWYGVLLALVVAAWTASVVTLVGITVVRMWLRRRDRRVRRQALVEARVARMREDYWWRTRRRPTALHALVLTASKQLREVA